MEEVENITNCIFDSIDEDGDVKNIDDYTIAITLLQDCDNEIEIMKKMK